MALADDIKTRAAPTLGQRLARAWDSDIAWSFRHSPVTVVAAIVMTVCILLAASFCANWIAPHNAFDPAAPQPARTPIKPAGLDARHGAREHRVHARHRRSGPRPAVGHPVRRARVAASSGFSSATISRHAAGGRRSGSSGGVSGRGARTACIMRICRHPADSFPAILIALLVFGVARGVIAARSPSRADRAISVRDRRHRPQSNWAQYRPHGAWLDAWSSATRNMCRPRASWAAQPRASSCCSHVLPNVTGAGAGDGDDQPGASRS
jgi:peptide/nickel transport system permease protein